MTSDARDAEVAAVQRRFWEAANAHDRGTLEGLLDDAFLLVEADTLERKGKADFLREVGDRSEGEELLSFELAGVRVQRTDDMAVVYAQFHCEDEVDGERVQVSGNAVDVLVRRGGEWKVLGSVYGEVPPFQEC